MMAISIDITIGISRSSSLRPQSTVELPYSWCYSNLDEEIQYLVPFRDKCGPPEWRLSYPTLERDTILGTGDEVRLCYRILKLLVMLCQRCNASITDEKMLPQKTRPSTYCLKTCLFRYMKLNSPSWKEEDMLSHCIAILEVLLTYPGVHLKSFF